MGIWLELGIFLVVLLWGLWQIRDARQALERSRAARLRLTDRTVDGAPALPDPAITADAAEVRGASVETGADAAMVSGASAGARGGSAVQAPPAG